jgi:nucleoside-diphosphate-sugar epimerase
MNDDLDIPTRDQDIVRSTPGARTALVFGATGFIGRWLVKELLARGFPTTAAVRSSASGGRLAAWLEDHGAATHLLDTVHVDLGVDGVNLGPADVHRT